MELAVAMMIIGVLATMGFKGYKKFSAEARYRQAFDRVKTLSEGLDHYYIQKGRYPDLASWEAMVAADSPLVKENVIPANMPVKDPWDQAYEATSGKGEYTVRCIGDPSNQDKFGLIEFRPGRMQGTDINPQAKPAEGAPK